MKSKKIQKIAREVIQFEIDALKNLKYSVNNSFYKIIKLLLACKNGKVIISGVGKSGIIARKWAATFSSTGTPSFFLDASNASHGDLGNIKKNDCVIAISNSGETSELNNIIHFTKRFNITLISITSNAKSTLHKNATIGILYKKSQL